MPTPINPKTDALIVIDVQNDFIPGGSLAVSGGDEIISGIVELAEKFDTIILSQDWHPAGHKSFASSHGAEPFTQTQMPYGEQTLWPDHCVQGTRGAQFHDDLIDVVNRSALIVRKGMNPEVDSYSAFFENDQTTTTGLAGWLREKGIQRVFIVGLAYDFCAGFSALDAKRVGFQAVVVRDLARAIAAPVGEGKTSEGEMDSQLDQAGVAIQYHNPRPSRTISRPV